MPHAYKGVEFLLFRISYVVIIMTMLIQSMIASIYSVLGNLK